MKKTRFNNSRFYLTSALILIIILMMFANIACAKSDNGAVAENQTNTNSTDYQQTDSGTGTTVNEAEETTSVTIWDSCEPKERIFLMESINNFIKLNPEININIKHFRNEDELDDVFSASSLAGAGPELILAGFDSMQKLAKENVIKNLTDEIDYNIFIPGLVEISNFSEKKYIIPFSSSDFLILYYNKDIISEIPATFDEIVAISKESLSAKDPKYGILLNAADPEWAIPFVGEYLDWIYDYDSGVINLNSAAMENTLNFINNLYNVDKIIPENSGYEDMNNLFKSGKAAMIINDVSAVSEYRDAGLNFGTAKIPRNADGSTNPTPMISGLGFMVNNNCSSKSFEVVKNFINYMVSKEVQTSWTLNTSSFPSILDLEKDKLLNNDIIYNILLQAKICRGKPQEDDLRLITDVMKLSIESVIAGDITPEYAKDKMQEDIIKLKSGEIKVEDYTSTTTSK
ncbi:extracellular solute-binding protein [bacterium]|nr:extracellular solute-binding protein [bacterium]